MEKQKWVYDIEIYSNFFLMCMLNVNTLEKLSYEISPERNDTKKIVNFLKGNPELIGFNNIQYDSKMLGYLARKKHVRGRELVKLLKKYSSKIIKERQINFNPIVPQVDLMKIHHFDNKAKMTSLKLLEFNMGMKNIQSLPYHHAAILDKDQRQKVRYYCWNDIDATYLFYLKSKSKIKFRERMSEIYGIDCTNYNDTKIGEYILIHEIHKETGWDIKHIKSLRTYRDSMAIKDIIFPYISFNSVEFNTLLTWWKTQVITETKGQFSELELESVEPLLPYCNTKLKKGKLAKLNIVYKGFQYDFGTGGIHGYSKGGIWKSDDEGELILVDVSSYYPMMTYFNKMHQAHFPQEVVGRVIYKLYQQKQNSKKIGDKESEIASKLALNGALYGKSNSEYSCLYDPQLMMQICVNGQLMLVSLSEQIQDAGIEIIQINTDGILVKVSKDKRPTLDKLCEDWMKLTSLTLDYDHFSLIVQRDVNNYLGVYTNGKIKRKGTFDWKYKEKGEWHKNFSQLIVAKAVEEYYVNGIDVATTIMEEKDINLFFNRVKLTRKDHKLVARYDNLLTPEDEELEAVQRYLITNTGPSLIKIMPPLKGKTDDRETGICVGYKVLPCNNIEGLTLQNTNINYNYYIMEAYKIINKIEN